MLSLLRRVGRACVTLPDGRAWVECAGLSLVALAVIAPVALVTGVAHWQPRPDGWPLRLLSVLIMPAFVEELIFRGVLIPAKGESRYPARWLLVGIGAFVLWHVIEALTFLPGAQLFLKPSFLLCAALLGGVCAAMRYRTGSLWPAVLLHGLLVFAWQMLLGGPAIKDLL